MTFTKETALAQIRRGAPCNSEGKLGWYSRTDSGQEKMPIWACFGGLGFGRNGHHDLCL